MRFLLSAAVFCVLASVAFACTPSVTTVSGSQAPATVCSGQLIFEDNFNTLDQNKWRHEITLAGGGNWEFQWYVNDRFNSYTVGGNLHLKPTFTSDIFGEDFLTSGRVVIPPSECTQTGWYGCDRQGTPENLINPIRSARLDGWDKFHFKYGTMEIRAKMPAGDWIWPALWLMPRYSVYGGWPASGEIDLMESRGNRGLFNGAINVGTEQAGSTMHFGPNPSQNAWPTAHFNRNQIPGFHAGFHVYRLEWTPTGIRFLIDGVLLGTVDAGQGFWQRGGFTGPNPWQGASIMAPFDQEFFIIINNAVGGTNFFPDPFRNNGPTKPWHNDSPTAMRDFWRGRSGWEPTWNKQTDDSHLQVDYVRVWAL